MRKLKLFLDAKAANTPPRGISKASRVIFSVLTLLLLSVGNVWATDYQLVTSTSDLEANANYVIGSAASGSGVFMATTSNNNNRRGTESITITNGKISATDAVLVLELGGSTGAWTFKTTNYAGTDGYLAAASNNSNYCQVITDGTQTRAKFTISFSDDAVVITATGGGNRRNMRHNPNNGNPLFACYQNATDQSPIYLYKEVTGGGSASVAVTGVTLDKNEAEVAVGGTVSLTATVAPSNATTKTVTWESDDEDIATVDGGVVTGVAEGTATITVKTTDGNKTATCEVTVTAATPAPTDDADVVLDLLDGNWGLPTSGTNTQLATFTNSVTGYAIKCYAATNYKVGSDYLIIGKANSYIELPTFSSPVEKIVVVKGNGSQPSGSVVFNIYDGNDAVSTAATGCATDKEFEIENPAANKTYTLKITSSHNLQLSAIKIYFGEAPDVAKPTISGGTPFLNTTSVSISIPEGTTVYYTTDGSNPKTSETKQTYSAAFNLSANATVKAIATDGANWSEPVEKSFVKATVMTVAQARAAIDAGGDLSNKFVAGIISQIDGYNSTYNSITYWISDDGTTTNQLQVYSGLAGVVKSAFASKDDLAVGDDVTVKGTLKKYNSTYEFDYNNTIEAYKPIARLAWSAESYDASLEGTNTFPTLTNTYSVDVTYSSSDAAKASFADASVYDITLNAVGSTTITASFAGNETYKANSVSYTLNVASSLVTLTYNVDGGEAIDPVNVSALPNPLPTTTKAGKNFGGWFTDSEKEVAAVPGAAISENTTLYAKWLDPYTVAEAKTVIDANPSGIENQYVAGIISQIDSYNNTYHSITYWISADGTTTDQLQVYSGLIGNAATALEKEQFTAKEDLELGDEVVVTGTLKLYNEKYEFDKNNSIYTFSRKVSAGLEYAETAIQKTVGDDLFTNPLTNPNSVTVTYSSSDEDVAVVDENTGEVLVGEEGTATITAAFAGNSTYKAAEVSYTITVNAATPAPTNACEWDLTAASFDAESNVQVTWSCDQVSMVADKANASTATNNYLGGDHNTTRFYKSSTLTFTPEEGYQITGIVVNGESGRAAAFGVSDSWTNATASIDGLVSTITPVDGTEAVMITFGSNAGATAVSVSYAEAVVKIDPELEWSEDEFEINLGDEFNAPTLSYKDGFTGTITYASDNEELATVSNAGVIELVAEATGTAKITASFAGDETYKKASAICTITVNSTTPAPETTDNVVIIAEYGSKSYAMTNDLKSGALTAIEITKDGDNIVVPSEEAKVAIQWTKKTSGENTTFQDADAKYLAHTGTGTSLTLQDNPETPEVWTWHADGYYYAVEGRTFFYYKDGIFKNYSVSNLPSTKTDYSGAPEIRVIAAENIIVEAPTTHTLSYNANGGTLMEGEDAIADAQVAEGAQVTVAANVYEKEGYVFAGWQYGETVYNAGQKFNMPTTDVELVAQWATISTDNVVIIAQSLGQWYAIQAEAGTANHTVKAVPIVYENNTIYLVESKRASITWERKSAGAQASFKNGTNYLTGKTSDSNDLDLGADECWWTFNSTSNIYQTHADHSLLYSESAEVFKNYKSTNAGKTGYSALPIVVPAVFGDPSYEIVRQELIPNAYYTMCLEKAVDAVQGGSIWRVLSKAQNDKDIILEEVTGTLQAGRPYIFYATSDIFKVVYAGSAVLEPVNDEGNNGLVGSFTQEPIAQSLNNFIIYNNALYYVNSDNVYVGANRAYLNMTGVPAYSNEPQQGAPRRRVTMAVYGEQTATGVDAINATDAPVKMMINGQLFILRGEKMYDATGRLVK